MVVWTIDQYRRSGRYNLRNCAIMYRTNAQSRALEDVFVRANIPYARVHSRRDIRMCWPTCGWCIRERFGVSLNRILKPPTARHRTRDRGDAGRVGRKTR